MGKRRGNRLSEGCLTNTELLSLMRSFLMSNIGKTFTTREIYNHLIKSGYQVAKRRLDCFIPGIIRDSSGIARVQDGMKTYHYFIPKSYLVFNESIVKR